MYYIDIYRQTEKTPCITAEKKIEKTNMIDLIGKILGTNRDAPYKSKIPMSVSLERENGQKLVY